MTQWARYIETRMPPVDRLEIGTAGERDRDPRQQLAIGGLRDLDQLEAQLAGTD